MSASEMASDEEVPVKIGYFMKQWQVTTRTRTLKPMPSEDKHLKGSKLVRGQKIPIILQDEMKVEAEGEKRVLKAIRRERKIQEKNDMESALLQMDSKHESFRVCHEPTPMLQLDSLNTSADTDITQSLQKLSLHQEPQEGFLKLPAELRNMIYRMLLTTEYTFYKAPFSHRSQCRYYLSSAILRANKQIYHEALSVLLNDNFWITIRGHSDLVGKKLNKRNLSKELNSVNFVPVVSNTIPSSIKKPALSIGLGYLPSYHYSKLQELLIGPESLEFLIWNLWNINDPYKKEDPKVLMADIHIHFCLRSSMKCDRLRLQEHLLKPFLNVHGLGRITFYGAVDLTFDSRLCRQMHFPQQSLRALLTNAEQMHHQGDKLYAQGRYDDACYAYDAAWRFLQHRRDWPWSLNVDEDPAKSQALTFRCIIMNSRAMIIRGEAQAAHTALDYFEVRGMLPYLSKFLRAVWHLLHAVAAIVMGKTDSDDWIRYRRQNNISTLWNPARAALAGAMFDLNRLKSIDGGIALVAGEFIFLRTILQEANLWISSEDLDRKIEECFKVSEPKRGK